MSYRSLPTRLALAASLPFLACAAEPPSITAVSNRPGEVSGGDVLVRVTLPAGGAPSGIQIRRNGDDVTAVFRPDGDMKAMLGLVSGLRDGENTIAVLGKDSSAPLATLTVVNHPISGPVFSGPQEQPFLCQTARFKLPDGTKLGEPLDANCSVKTVVQYVYRSTEKGAPVKPLASISSLPADVAKTTTSLGRTVPYVVRVETGVINRSIYQIAVLHDPTSGAAPSPHTPPEAWNRRLLYAFGGGCVGGWYKQGETLGFGPNVVSDSIVGKGYASVSASLNVFGNNCQDITAAETMMMVKEHFIESYGVPLFTFGRGGSGGSYQQIQISNNYPGLLDGIIPSATFPDVLATIQFLTDIELLKIYYEKDGASLSDEKKQAIAGVGVLKTVFSAAGGAKRISANGTCPAEITAAQRYHATNNPKGVRCDVFDHTVNAYGRDPQTGYARRPIDNTGVQYGLAALNKGAITVAEFLDLNEKIGGHDSDGNPSDKRAVADPLALRAAYETGRVSAGMGALGSIPIIDVRGYSDMRPNGDLHTKYHSFSFRERVRRANGNIDNMVMLVVGAKSPQGFDSYQFTMMDRWLTRLSEDTSNDPKAVKVARAKPPELTDACWDESGNKIVEPQTLTGGECNKHYPAFPSPRMLAGEPIAGDVLKCQLKPIDYADYKAAFTDADKLRLQAIFPAGVCDWSKPGVEQRPTAGVWRKY